MSKQIVNYSFAVFFTALFITCDKNVDTPSIIYNSINEEIILIRDVQTLQASNDQYSNHVDSILNGLIDEEIISTGQQNFNIDQDNRIDIGFEIIDLNLFNDEKLPETLDSLAARVIPVTMEILDNSTFGYPDALDADYLINDDANWSNSTSVLGTFLASGQFKGKGEKFLGVRFAEDGNFKYGWIKLYCSEHNDTLRIIDFAYNNVADDFIKAGQTE